MKEKQAKKVDIILKDSHVDKLNNIQCMISDKSTVCPLPDKTFICKDNKMQHCPSSVVGNLESITSDKNESITHLNVTDKIYNVLSYTIYGLGEHCSGTMCHYPGHDGLYVNFL